MPPAKDAPVRPAARLPRERLHPEADVNSTNIRRVWVAAFFELSKPIRIGEIVTAPSNLINPWRTNVHLPDS